MEKSALTRPLPSSLLTKRSGMRWLFEAWQLAAFPLLLLISIPILAIFLELTPAKFLAGLQDPKALAAIRLSASTSLITVVITLLFGTPVSYLLYRRRSKITTILDTLVDLPTVLPPAIAGLALLIAFGRQGLLGEVFNSFGIRIPFTTAAVVIAQVFVAAPLYIKSAALGFAGVDCELKKAAALDGANRFQVFRHITLPLSWNAIVSGSILTLARALGEFGATIIFAGNLAGRTQTMPLAIFIAFEVDLKVALALSAVLVLFSSAVLAALKLFLNNHLNEN